MGGRRTSRVAAGFAAVALVAGACGGGDDDDSLSDLLDAAEESGDLGDPSDQTASDIDDVVDAADGSGGAIEVVAAPSITVDPGLAVVEVDGQTLEYRTAGSIALTCEVAPESVQVNIQTPEGQSIAVRASMTGGDWFGSITAGAEDSNVQYSSDMFGGTLGIGDGAVSYSGPMIKIVDFDIVNAEDVIGTMAVNCATPGGDPSATVGGQEFVFPVSGAQSFQCMVLPEEFEIRVNRLALEGLQLEMQGRNDGTQWIGSVTVYTNDGNLSAPLPPDGAGLTIDGTSVTFDGTFTAPDGTESTGSASATC